MWQKAETWSESWVCAISRMLELDAFVALSEAARGVFTLIKGLTSI
jgi:hypothetical protein